MATHAEELNLILFLEGIQVPVIGANVSMSSDFPASASIRIIATPEAFKLDVRTLVHLFFLDLKSKAKTSDFFTKPNPYSLLFCGEIIGINFSKSEGSRSITLNCRDHRSYYDTAYTYLFRSKSLAGNPQTSSIEAMLKSKAAFAGANQHLLNFITEDGVAGFISNIFKDPTPVTPQFRNCKGVLGGIIKAIEAFTGLSSSAAGGANAFFTFADARLKILGQLGVYPEDEASSKLLSSQHMMSLLKQKGDQLGDLASLNQVIRYILGFIYYRMTPNTCARFLPSTVFKTNASAQVAIKKVGIVLDIVLRNIKDTFNEFRNKNITTSQQEEVAIFQMKDRLDDLRAFMPENFLSSITLTSEMVRNALQAGIDPLKSIPTAGESFTKEFSEGRTPSEIDWAIIDRHKWSNKDLYNLLNEVKKLKDSKDPSYTFFSSITYKLVRDLIRLLIESSPILNLPENSENMNDNIIMVKVRQKYLTSAKTGRYSVAIDRLLSYILMISTGVTTQFSQQTSPKLYTTLILPDLFFSVAPRCNVVFPDMYYTASYSRNMVKEVTRLQLSTSEDQGLLRDPVGVGKIHFYAPSTTELIDIQSKPLASNKLNKAELAWTGNRLMDHELFSGIVPDFSHMDRMLLETALLSDMNKSTSKEARNDFYIRIANYQFLKKRLEGRQLSVTGVFNPNAAVGFPMVVIDNSYDTDREYSEQFIGLLTSLSHSVTQQGGSTSYQLSHVRPHRSKDDPFINSLNLGIKNAAELGSIDLHYNEVLNEVVRAYRGASSPDILANDILANTAALNEACKKLKLMMAVTVHAGEKGKDFLVSENSSLMSSTKNGDGLMEGKIVPSVPGKAREGATLDISLEGDMDIEGVKIAGIEVLDSAPCGGSAYAVGYANAAALMQDIFNSVDPTVIWTSNYKNARKVKRYYHKSRRLVFGKRTEENRQEIIKLTSTLVRTPDIWYKRSEPNIGSFLHQSIESLRPADLGLICDHYAKIGGRFLVTGFQSIRVYYEKRSSETLTPPLEEAMRPSFVDSAYASPNIGEKVYKELLGVNSIVDLSKEVIEANKINLKKTSVGYSGSLTGHGEIIEVVSQEDAIDALCSAYASSSNKSEFSRDFIRRDIANINDVIGTEGSIHYKAFSTPNELEGSKKIPFMGLALEVGQGEPLIEGMRAATPDEQTYIEEAVDKRVDVRGLRHDTVLNYVQSLSSRGLKG